MTPDAGAAAAVPASATGTTTIAGVIGHPVAHSRSPAIHNAAFSATGLDWVYAAFDVAPGEAGAAVAAMGTLGLGGLSVTMPHKEDAFTALERRTSAAQRLRSVNCVYRDGPNLIGASTDGDGLVASLMSEGHDAAGRRCVVLGTGGAARSVVEALSRIGAAEVVVVGRRVAAAHAAAALAGSVGRTRGFDAPMPSFDLLVNATSVGMADTATAGQCPVRADVFEQGQLVVDLVYHPLETPLLAAARRGGATTMDGLGMLIHQAAFAFQLWTGVAAPIAAMTAAARTTRG